MFDVSFLLILIIIVALIFDFTNGAHDCANAIATVVSTKVLSPRTAVIMAATLNLIGPASLLLWRIRRKRLRKRQLPVDHPSPVLLRRLWRKRMLLIC